MFEKLYPKVFFLPIYKSVLFRLIFERATYILRLLLRIKFLNHDKRDAKAYTAVYKI